MTIITLNFLPHLAQANTDGRKYRTARLRQHGNPGDVFFCRGIAYCICAVSLELLPDTTSQWKAEGYERKIDCQKELQTIYPELEKEIFFDVLFDRRRAMCRMSMKREKTDEEIEQLRKEQLADLRQREWTTTIYAHYYYKWGRREEAPFHVPIGRVQQ